MGFPGGLIIEGVEDEIGSSLGFVYRRMPGDRSGLSLDYTEDTEVFVLLISSLLFYLVCCSNF